MALADDSVNISVELFVDHSLVEFCVFIVCVTRADNKQANRNAGSQSQYIYIYLSIYICDNNCGVEKNKTIWPVHTHTSAHGFVSRRNQ